jgi:hypothetical protein
MSIRSFERFPLLFGQSPVHRLDRLTRHLGGAATPASRTAATRRASWSTSSPMR